MPVLPALPTALRPSDNWGVAIYWTPRKDFAVSAHAPITGPCAWLGSDMIRSSRWIRDLRPADIGEIEAALGTVERRGLAWHDIEPADFPLPGLAGLLSDIAEELENGCGMVKLRGLPVARYSE